MELIFSLKSSSMSNKGSLLKKQPETELEYWLAIETLGGYVSSTNRLIAKEHLPEGNTEINNSVQSAQAEQQSLLKEIGEKFGVVPPGPKTDRYDKREEVPLLEGQKSHYWDWYEKMKLQSCTEDYELLVCSACPFSQGVQEMMRITQLPCSAVNGSIYGILGIGTCGAVSRNYSEKKLFAEITKKAGKAGRDAFINKRKVLQEAGVKSSFNR